MAAVVAILAGLAVGVPVGVLAARLLPWRLSRRIRLLVVGLATVAVCYEVWFVFVFARADEGARTDLVPLLFHFAWTLSATSCGAAAAARRDRPDA